MPPTRPDTGFGYIRIGDALADGAHAIDGFVEKPAEEIAAQYVAAGTYWWNSGIFIVRASVWLDTLERLQPDMHAACERASHEAATPTARISVRSAMHSCSAPADSIDYAVMEHHRCAADAPCNGVVVPLEAGWSDLGSWDAVWAAMEKDANGNAGAAA